MNVSGKKPAPAEQQAHELTASLDDAAEDLERNGPVPAAAVKRPMLTVMEDGER